MLLGASLAWSGPWVAAAFVGGGAWIMNKASQRAESLYARIEESVALLRSVLKHPARYMD